MGERPTEVETSDESDRSKGLPEKRLEGREELLGELLVSLHPINEENRSLALRRQAGKP
jgi:hypothetical protein